ncbi:MULTISPECIES: hypothetical protein [Pseudomonas]|uniref:hypothetical protein n=1 Tax=Pseudomonas TaxID=286 RepID=UPI002AC60C7C|nr:hypothetical protein [Pseudomonas putida]MDZ5111419.1 hypothetical protein [Pseudomonas putida]
MKTLHYIPAPYPNESPSSLLRRIALNNGFKTIPRFCERTNLTPAFGLLLQQSSFHSLLLQEYAEINYLPAFYKKLSFKRGHLIDIGNCEVPAVQLNCLASGICTECLSTGWEHKIKDLRCMECCPIHLCRYLFCCPNCRIRFTPLTQLSTICGACGACLSCEMVTPETAELELTLLAIFERKDQAILDNFFHALKKLNYRVKTYTSQISRILALCSMDIALGNITSAYHRLNDNILYPESLCCRLITAQLLYASRIPIPPTTIANLNSLHRVNNGKIPGISFTTPELRTALGISHDLWVSVTFAKFKKSTRDRFTADEILEIHNLHQTEFRNKTNEFAVLVNAAQARQLLDVPKKLVTKLLRLGHLRKLHTDKFIPSQITQRSLENLNNEYISVWAVNKSLKIDITSIQNATIESGASYLDLHEKNMPHLINRNSLDIVQEHLSQAKNCNKENKNELSKALEIRAIYPLQQTEPITLREACRRLACWKTELLALIRCGILKSHRFGNRHMLSPADISIIKRKFITLGNLSKSTNLHRTQIMRIINELKIQSIEYRSGKALITLFKKGDIKKINFDDFAQLESELNSYNYNRKAVTFDQARKELGISRLELAKIKKKIIQRRPHAYQSCYFKRVFTHTELEKLKEIVSTLTPLEALVSELGLSSRQIKLNFQIVKNEEIIHLNKVSCISQSLALDIRAFYNNYITMNAAATSINVTPNYLIKMLAMHPDPAPYLKSAPLVKCISSGHLHFLFKLNRGLPESFCGPIKLL